MSRICSSVRDEKNNKELDDLRRGESILGWKPAAEDFRQLFVAHAKNLFTTIHPPLIQYYHAIIFTIYFKKSVLWEADFSYFFLGREGNLISWKLTYVNLNSSTNWFYHLWNTYCMYVTQHQNLNYQNEMKG